MNLCCVFNWMRDPLGRNHRYLSHACVSHLMLSAQYQKYSNSDVKMVVYKVFIFNAKQR